MNLNITIIHITWLKVSSIKSTTKLANSQKIMILLLLLSNPILFVHLLAALNTIIPTLTVHPNGQETTSYQILDQTSTSSHPIKTLKNQKPNSVFGTCKTSIKSSKTTKCQTSESILISLPLRAPSLLLRLPSVTLGRLLRMIMGSGMYQRLLTTDLTPTDDSSQKYI